MKICASNPDILKCGSESKQALLGVHMQCAFLHAVIGGGNIYACIKFLVLN